MPRWRKFSEEKPEVKHCHTHWLLTRNGDTERQHTLTDYCLMKHEEYPEWLPLSREFDDEPCGSGWIPAPLPNESEEEAAKHGRRWPTEADAVPGFNRIPWCWIDAESGIQECDYYRFDDRDWDEQFCNLHFLLFPPLPPLPKRELPPLALTEEQLPCKVTLRDGRHAYILAVDSSGDSVAFQGVAMDAYRTYFAWLSSGKSLNFSSQEDVVALGHLTAEELEALKR